MRVEVVDESTLPRTSRNSQLQPYLEALKQLQPGKALRVSPELDETVRALKRRLRAAASEAEASIEFMDFADGFFVAQPQTPRTRSKRGAATSPTGRRRGRPPKSAQE